MSWNAITPTPSADRYETTTEAARYRGATTARSSMIKINSTTAMVSTMMNRMSWL